MSYQIPQEQKQLIYLLKAAGVPRDDAVHLVLMVSIHHKESEAVAWLESHPGERDQIEIENALLTLW